MQEELVPPSEPLTLEVYLARASIAEAEYEQYKIEGARIYAECGSVRRGRQFAKQRSMFTLDEEIRSDITLSAYKTFNLAKSKGNSLPAPEDADGFADPGQALLKIAFGSEKMQLNTNVDTVSAQELPLAGALNATIVRVRKAAIKPGKKPLCGNAQFYGISGPPTALP